MSCAGRISPRRGQHGLLQLCGDADFFAKAGQVQRFPVLRKIELHAVSMNDRTADGTQADHGEHFSKGHHGQKRLASTVAQHKD
jgi:hypothetical protein